MKITLNIFLGTIILIGCTENSKKIKVIDNINNEVRKSYVLDSLDYEIINEAIFQSATISLSLSHRYKKNTHFTLTEIKKNLKNIVIVDSTYYIENAGVDAIQSHFEIDNSDSSWIDNLTLKNRYNAKIFNLPDNYFDYKIFPCSKFDSIFYNKDLGWDYFWKIYEFKSVIIRVSIPAYNQSKDRAVLYLEHHISGENGEGNVIWLKREDKHWVAYDIVIIWIS